MASFPETYNDPRRFSDSGKVAKVKGTLKVGGGAGVFYFFHVLISAYPTISEPGTGYLLQPRLHPGGGGTRPKFGYR